MKQTYGEGFTLMESLVSIAIILILSGCIIIAFSTGMKANIKSVGAIRTANTILETDRFIREQVDSLHIPYWLKPEESIEKLKNQLWRSKVGKYIHEIAILYDTNGNPRGITVDYLVGTKNMKTSALFPFHPVKDVQ